MSAKNNKTTTYIIAVIGSIFFGMTFLGAKIALVKLDAIEVLACRWTLAFVLFIAAILLGLIKVDFPAPEEPTIKTNSPSLMRRLTSLRATVPFGYFLVTF